MRHLVKSLVCTSFVLMALTSCEKFEQLFPRTKGSEIVFGSSSERGVSTKAAYSGEISPSGYERINWVLNDTLRIYCKQAEKPVATKYADYFVYKDITSVGAKSSAKISHDPEDQGLTWGEKNTLHEFAALYPAPGHGEAGISVAENSVTCVLPAVQKHTGITYRKESNKSPLAGLNPKYVYLAGYGEADSGDGEGSGAVELFFDPAITTFEFTLQNDYDSGNDMTIASAGITTESGKLAGTYTVGVKNINGTSGLQTTDISLDISSASDKITMNFSPHISIAKSDSLTFTLFAQPGNDITKLTFWMIDSDGVERRFAFKYSDSSLGTDGWVDFKAFHKAKIRGLMAPESAGWTINLIPRLAEWGAVDRDLEVDDGNVLTFTTPVVKTWIPEDNGSIFYSE